jgi:hypothetical protein
VTARWDCAAAARDAFPPITLIRLDFVLLARRLRCNGDMAAAERHAR